MSNTPYKTIRGLLESEHPRAKSLVVTVFGDSIAPHGGEVWLSQLVDLLEPFGVGDRLVRSSVFRLVRDGWLRSHREGRRSRYELTASGRLRFERAHRRIYERSDEPWDRRWLFICTFSLKDPKRAVLRRELEWEGFRLLTPGMMGRPGGDVSAVGEILERLRCRRNVFVGHVSEVKEIDSRPFDAARDTMWNLSSVNNAYRKFLKRFRPVAELAKGASEWTPGEAFAVRTLLIHSFRRALLHDPQLPAEMLPASWPGIEAWVLCREIYRLVHPRAEERVRIAIAPDGKADAVFAKRFGGLV